MFKQILDYIKKYDTIIISRHLNPDLDALGSQFGLKHIIQTNFPLKNVYVVGDMNKPCFLGSMDEIDESIYEDALFIYVDVSVDNMIAKLPYYNAKQTICIDHHKNDCNLVNAKAYYNKNAAAAAQIIAEFAFSNNLKISNEAAIALYSGIVSDTNRFNFSLSKDLFDTVGKLIDLGFDYSFVYKKMYNDKVSNVKMRAYFQSKFEVNEYGVAYLINKEDVYEKFNVDFFTISRGMVNVMANLEEVKIWCNFTFDPKTCKIGCEFRSKNIIILPVAVKYGGGGHNLACGCTISSFETVNEILKDMNDLAKE